MNKKFKNTILNILIVVLLCTSVVLIFKNQIREYLTGNANDKIITAYKNGKGEVDIPWWQKMFTEHVVIAGHSVQGVGIRFNNLTKIKNGAKIQIISKDKLRTYEVNKLYDVVPTQVEILEQHENEPKILKLFTCDNFNPQTGEWESRFVVEAKLIGEESA